MSDSFVVKWSMIFLAAIAGAWLKIPHAVQILILMMGLDILSGIIAAIATRTLNSSMMVRGLFKKLAVFPLLAMLHIVEKPLTLPFEFETLAAIAFIVYEAMSITENAALAGLPVPAVIVAALAKAKIQTATPDEIHRQFSGAEQTKMSVDTSTQVVRTPDSSPDLKIEKKVTTLEETHVSPIPPDLAK